MKEKDKQGDKEEEKKAEEKGMLAEAFYEVLAGNITQYSADVSPEVHDYLAALLNSFYLGLEAVGLPKLAAFPMEKPDQLFRLMGSVQEPELEGIKDESLRAAVYGVRAKIFDSLVVRLFDRHECSFGDREELDRHLADKDLARLTVKFMELVRREGVTDTIKPKWLEKRDKKLYSSITIKLLERGDDDWTRFLNLLPCDLRKYCEFEKVQLSEAKDKLDKAVAAYTDIINQWPELAPDIFVFQHKEFADSEEAAKNAFRDSVGEFSSKPPGGERTLAVLPPAVLECPDIRRVVELILRKQIYRDLVELHDEPLKDGKSETDDEQILEYAKQIIHDCTHPNKDEDVTSMHKAYKEIEDALVLQFEEILSYKTPERMKGVVVKKDGKGTRSGIYLRQKIAMYDMLHLNDYNPDLQGKLIAFYMGMGKTLASFLAYEVLRKEKFCKGVDGVEIPDKKSNMLYICPGGVLPEQVKAQVVEHYDEDDTPSVGVISRAVKQTGMERILENEIVIVPYSMLTQRRAGKTIVKHLCDKGFDFVVQDEPQNANKTGQAYTEAVKAIISHRDTKSFVQLSGNPFPNTPEDSVAQLALALPNLYKGARVNTIRELLEKKELNLRKLRAALYEFILCLDEPENLDQYKEECTVELSPAELALYGSIRASKEKLGKKITRMLLALSNPALISPGMVEHSVADACGDKLFEYLEGNGDAPRDSVVMFECLRKQGILRRHHLFPDTPSFYENVQERVRELMKKKYGEAWKDEIDYYTIDGDTSDQDRAYFLLRSQHPEYEPTIRLFLMATSLEKKKKEYEDKIEQTTKNLALTKDKLDELKKEKGIEKSDEHRMQEANLRKAVRESRDLASALIVLLKKLEEQKKKNKKKETKEGQAEEKKIEKEINSFAERNPCCADVVSRLLSLQKAEDKKEKKEEEDSLQTRFEDEKYVLDDEEVFEDVYDALLGSEEMSHLMKWLDENDEDKKIRSICADMVNYRLDLGKLEQGKDVSKSHWEAEMRKYLEEKFPLAEGDRRSHLEKFESAHQETLLKLAELSDGNFRKFENLLSEFDALQSWLMMNLEGACPNKCKKVVVYSWLTIIHEGIDLSLADRGIFVNPAWRNPDVAQAIKRLVRHGLGALFAMINVPESLYDGIREHAMNKNDLVERLLYGGSFTQEELDFIDKESKDKGKGKPFIIGGRMVLSPVLRQALTPRQLLGRMILGLHNVGVKEFMKFLQRHGEEYARLYMEVWEGTISANNGRFVAALIENLRADESLRDQGVNLNIRDCLDVASGPCVFENTYGLSASDRSNLRITNIDLNSAIMEAGKLKAREYRENPSYEPKNLTMSMTDLEFEDESFDLVNCAFAMNYLSQKAYKHIDNNERAISFMEMRRVLRPNGILTLTLTPKICTDEQFEELQKALPYFGLEVLDGYSGIGSSTDNKSERKFTNRVITCRAIEPKVFFHTVDGKVVFNKDKLDISPEELLAMLKLEYTAVSKPKTGKKKKPSGNDPKIQEMHHNQFELNNSTLEYSGTEADIDRNIKAKTYREKVSRARSLMQELLLEFGFDRKSYPQHILAELDEMGVKDTANDVSILGDPKEEIKKVKFMIPKDAGFEEPEFLVFGAGEDDEDIEDDASENEDDENGESSADESTE